MATGMEMVLKSLRGFIPEHVWAAVEKNIISMGEKVAAIEKRLAGIEECQQEILNNQMRLETMLTKIHTLLSVEDLPDGSLDTPLPEALNGATNSTEDGPRQL